MKALGSRAQANSHTHTMRTMHSSTQMQQRGSAAKHSSRVPAVATKALGGQIAEKVGAQHQPQQQALARPQHLHSRRASRRSGGVACQAFFQSLLTPSAPAAPPAPTAASSNGASHDYSKIPLGGDMPKDYDRDTPNWTLLRRAGVILHPTSLPGPYGIGEIGEQGRLLVDWIISAGLRVWQVLPMVPPDPMFFSPYSGTDSNAGNPLVISIDELIKDGLLDASDAPPRVPVADVEYAKVRGAPTRVAVTCPRENRASAHQRHVPR